MHMHHMQHPPPDTSLAALTADYQASRPARDAVRWFAVAILACALGSIAGAILTAAAGLALLAVASGLNGAIEVVRAMLR